jgi:hypothetical protein
VLLTGCTRAGDETQVSSPAPAVAVSTSSPAPAPATTLPATPTTAASTPVAGPTVAATSVPVPQTLAVPVLQDDLVRFVAATEVALAGTPDAGVVEEQPEVFIALAQAACARFSGGDSFDTVAGDLLADMSASGASERLVGAILGAATRTICPEHAALVPVG